MTLLVQVEPVKLGESFEMLIPSQAYKWEGVETRRLGDKGNIKIARYSPEYKQEKSWW